MRDLLHRPDDDISTVSRLIAALDDKAFPVLIFIFAAINIIPAVPGASGILGLPVVIIAAQRALGRKVILPGTIMGARIPITRFRAVIAWMIPRLSRMEQLIKPRLTILFTPTIHRIVDFLVLVIALSVLVPLPFTAMLPAFCICLISLGRMESDGGLVLAGSVLGVVAVLITLGILTIALKGAALVLLSPV